MTGFFTIGDVNQGYGASDEGDWVSSQSLRVALSTKWIDAAFARLEGFPQAGVC
ncbi:hypothetical protein OKW09_001552 [Pseudomonas rhodesiae]|nr:hypothetical protein [Pseudomonas rhodesiae]MDF9769267.1 hypothetical protein [Pseudomonas rhodesiae]